MTTKNKGVIFLAVQIVYNIYFFSKAAAIDKQNSFRLARNFTSKGTKQKAVRQQKVNFVQEFRFLLCRLSLRNMLINIFVNSIIDVATHVCHKKPVTPSSAHILERILPNTMKINSFLRFNPVIQISITCSFSLLFIFSFK